MDHLVSKMIWYVVKLGADEVVSWWGVKDDLKKLDDTLRMIKAVLDVAEERQAMGQADAVIKEWLRRLKKVLYVADDLFDDVFTVKQQTAHSLTQGSKLEQVTKKVLLPMSKLGPIRFNHYVAGQIKSIRKKLDAIKADSGYNGSDGGVNVRRDDQMHIASDHLIKIGETSSSVPVDIVGREDDKNKIVEMLLSELDTTEGSISVIPIVGKEGIGKSTLAQLVFNDNRVIKHFELTKWVWLSHTDNDQKEVIGKFFTAFTNTVHNGSSLEHLESSIRALIENKKYLLVLDNVWCESHERLRPVINFLCCGKRVSKIIVTTRSPIVAVNVGTLPNPYKINFLSDDESWDLFQKVALPGNNPNLIPIGREIVTKCRNVPLAIRAIGGALRGKDETEWRRFEDSQLARIDQSDTRDVMSLLKLSYDRLPSHLKQCFAYFAFSPESDAYAVYYTIYSWMSLGFINQSSSVDPEDVGLQYFRELLSKTFLQDVITYERVGVTFRVHDLMKELAAHVADGLEVVIVNASFRNDSFKKMLNDEIRHLSLHFVNCDSWEAPLSFPNAGQIRYLGLKNLNPDVLVETHRLENMLSIFVSLRHLELRYLKIESVPDAVGQLRHLRFLRILCCPIKCLPSSIKRLWNLQTMILDDCRELKALPTGISRLINLRCLLWHGCDLIKELPPDFGKLKSLQNLTHFIVSKSNGLDALADMNLRGDLEIRYQIWRKDDILEARKANFKEKQMLKGLSLWFDYPENIPHDVVSLLEEFQPPPSLESLIIQGYQGESLPSWAGDGLGRKLPKLINLKLDSFKRCRFLSSGLHQLPCLKHLILSKLPELREWSRVSLEEDDAISEVSMDDGEDGRAKATFPCLEILEIYECPQLISIPFTPRLQKFIGNDIHVGILGGEEAPISSPCITEVYLTLVHGLHSMVVKGGCFWKRLEIRNCRQLTSIRVKLPSSMKHLIVEKCQRFRKIQGLPYLSSLRSMLLLDCDQINELPTSMDHLMSLEALAVSAARKWTALPGSIGRLTALQYLAIGGSPELRCLPDTFNSLTQLRALHIGGCPKMSSYIESASFSNLLHSFPLLEVLLLNLLPDLKVLPVSIQHLPHLTVLVIANLPELKELPHWFTKLTSLKILHIWKCPHIEKRYADPDQQDRSLIKHIPDVFFKYDIGQLQFNYHI